MPPARGQAQRHVRLPGQQAPLKGPGRGHVLAVGTTGAEPELREWHRDRYRTDPLERGVQQAQGLVPAERVHRAHRVAQPVGTGHEVPAEHARGAVAGRVAQGEVGRAVTALGVPGDAPRPPGRRHPQRPRQRAGQVHPQEGAVLRAVPHVEALKRDPRAAVGVRHDQDGGPRGTVVQECQVRLGDADHVDPVLRLAGEPGDQLDGGEAGASVAALEVLRRQVQVDGPGQVAELAPDGEADGLALLGGHGPAGDLAEDHGQLLA